MTRETSIAAYTEMRESGVLGGIRLNVVKILSQYGPLTQAEVSERTGNKIQRSVTPRFAELKKMGVIEEVGEKICPISGAETYIWDLTGRQPKVPTKREKIEEAIARCEEKLVKLREELEEAIECESPVPSP